eukprot:668585-Rhodomonas_salina.2
MADVSTGHCTVKATGREQYSIRQHTAERRPSATHCELPTRTHTERIADTQLCRNGLGSGVWGVGTRVSSSRSALGGAPRSA